MTFWIFYVTSAVIITVLVSQLFDSYQREEKLRAENTELRELLTFTDKPKES